MTTMTTVNVPAGFNSQGVTEQLRAYLSGAEYAEDVREIMINRLFTTFQSQVDALLPAGMTWHPGADEFLIPADATLPGTEELTEIFDMAWERVECSVVDVEQAVMGDLPTDIGELIATLAAIESPLHRARVCAFLADSATAKDIAVVRAAAVHEATRERGSAERVAGQLGVGIDTVRRLVREHNAAQK